MRKELIIKSSAGQGHGTWMVNLRVYNGPDGGDETFAQRDVTLASFTRVGLCKGIGALAMVCTVSYLQKLIEGAKLKIETNAEGLEQLRDLGIVDDWQILTE